MKSWQRLQLQYFNKHFEWLKDISCNGSFSFQSNTLLFTIWLDLVSNVNIVNYSTSQMQLQFTIRLHNLSNYNIFKLLLWYLEFMITVATNQYLESPSPPQVLIAPQHIGPPGHRRLALARAAGCHHRLPQTRSGSDDCTDCNGDADRIRVIPQARWLGVGREAQVTTIQPLLERHDAAVVSHGLDRGSMMARVVIAVQTKSGSYLGRGDMEWGGKPRSPSSSPSPIARITVAHQVDHANPSPSTASWS
jgi:hypothetical protein